jgi:NADH-quinone oxidoreductase subunit M
MLLASLLLKLGGYGILRFLLTFLTDASVFFTPLVVTLGIGGVVYGSLSTLRQIDLKRVIAYSSVAHMNLVVVGLFSFTRFGIEGAIYMMVAHGVVSSALFFLVGVIYDRTHTRLLRYYGGLVTVMPLFVSFFFVFSLANMGFPGTPNFPGELLILMGAFAIAPHVAFESGLGVVFSSAYSTFTHARISFGTLKTKYIHQFIDMLPREVSVVFVLLIVATVLGIQTAPVLTFVEVSS